MLANDVHHSFRKCGSIFEDDRITTQIPNGIWINETLNISGSTTITPQSATRVIYNVTNPYVEWDVIASGDYFSSVVPVSEGIWIWNLEVNMTGIDCTCWLEINQPYGMQRSSQQSYFCWKLTALMSQ